MTNIKERVLQIADFYEVTKENFFKELGLSYANFKGKQKNSGLSSDSIDTILTKYPEISPEWLVLGNGHILRNMNIKEFSDYTEDRKISYDNILSNAEPISDNTVEVLTNSNGNKFYIQEDDRIKIEVIKIPFPAYASYLETFEDEVKLHEEFSTITFPVDHIGRGNYIAFEVKGDSMNGGGIDDTPDGADILCREIGRHLWCGGFRRTKYGLVLLTKTGIYHKDITDFNADTGEITLESRNKDCEKFKLNLNDVYKIFNVIKRYF